MKRTLATIGVAALALAGCGDVELHSHYRDTDIAVDGKYDDWKGRTQYVEQAKMAVGVQNDDTDLYVILVIGDRETQHAIMMSGMYLWFDSAGERDRQFGIHYPLGVEDPAALIAPKEPGERRDPAEMREKLDVESLAEAELIAANGSKRITRSVENLPGIELRTSREQGAMVYEYRIPLAADVESPYGIGVDAGATVGVGLLTPEIDMSKVREDMREKMGDGGPGGRPGGGMPGGGRGGMGHGGGMPGGGPPEAPDPIDVWGRLILASRNE